MTEKTPSLGRRLVVWMGGLMIAGLFIAVLWPASLVNPIRQPMTKVNGELRSIATSVFDLHSTVQGATTERPHWPDFTFGPVTEVFPHLPKVIDPVRWDDIVRDDYHPTNQFYWAAAWKEAFVLIGVGPDEVLNVTEDQIRQGIEDGSIALSARLDWAYSPTNGLDSTGDIFRVQY